MKKILVLSIWYLVLSTANAQFIEFPLPVPSEGAWYTADNTPNDSWPGGYDLTLNGDATYGTDRNGNSNAAFSFDGTGDYADGSDIFINGSLSVSAFINVSSIPSGAGASRIVFMGEESSPFYTNYDLRIYQSSHPDTGKIGFAIIGSDLTYSYRVNTSSAISTSTWYHFVGTFNSTTKELSLYMNGTFIGSITATNWTSFTLGSSNFNIGATGTSDYFNGLIDDIRIIPYELTAEQVSHLYRGGR